MTCKQCEVDVHEYLRGTLSAAARAEVERHAAECSACGDLLRRCQELTCKDFVEFLNDYLDGDLDGQRHSVFDQHLSDCPDCRAYVASYRRTMELSVTALRGELAVPEEIPERLLQAIHDSRKQR